MFERWLAREHLPKTNAKFILAFYAVSVENPREILKMTNGLLLVPVVGPTAELKQPAAASPRQLPTAQYISVRRLERAGAELRAHSSLLSSLVARSR